MKNHPGQSVRREFLPLARPTIGEEEIAEVVDTLRSGWLTTGPKAGLFEKKIRAYLDIAEALAVSSGTAALHVALLAAGVGPGDEVITSSMTFAATANTIALCGAKPVLVDCEPGTLNIALDGVEPQINSRTKAIMPVHFAGQPCDMDGLMEIGRRHAIPIIEDAAHALGTEYKGRKIGSFGDMATFSFHPIKTITTGEGGMVVTRTKEWAERMRLLRFHGITTTAWERHSGGKSPQYSIRIPGLKYTLTDLQAAIGLHQMDKIDRFIEQRSKFAHLYHEAFAGIEGLKPLEFVPYSQRHAWHLFVVQLELERLTIDRDHFLELLKERNIGAGVHFPAVHLQPYYQEKWGYQRGDCPQAERASGRIVSLPLFPTMTEEDVRDVVKAVVEILREHWK